MIHFNFSVEDHEAEAIFGALNVELCDSLAQICTLTVDSGSTAEIEWHKSRVKYLQNLMSKMTNVQLI